MDMIHTLKRKAGEPTQAEQREREKIQAYDTQELIICRKIMQRKPKKIKQHIESLEEKEDSFAVRAKAPFKNDVGTWIR